MARETEQSQKAKLRITTIIEKESYFDVIKVQNIIITVAHTNCHHKWRV